ncbi:MAG: aminotransferase class III-fold pyridoxal phosphate-dependent enzyme, partial [Candidatus Hydrogenedentota bacterium]
IEKHSRAVSVRGLGLLIALELDAPSSQFADRLLYRCLELGLNFKTSSGRYVILTPPLTVSDEEVDEAIVVLDSALTDLGGEST